MVDLHCHLDLYEDPPGEIERLKERGVFTLSVTTTPSAWRKTRSLAESAPRIATALGLHPQLAEERASELELFDVLLPSTKYVGEIGLDGGEPKASHDIQRRVLNYILSRCSSASGRILTIHSRRAVDDVLDCLRKFPDAGVPVLHWFSGTPRQLKRAIDQGCWFSVGNQMCSSAKGREIVKAIPADRLITETDGPFCRVRGRPIDPGDVSGALGLLSDYRREPIEAAAKQILECFMTLRRSL